MTKEEFILELKKLNIDLDDDKLNKLEKYYQILVAENAKTNLTAITKKEDVFLKHFYDSLTIVKAIDLNSKNNLLDVGSGAGFPGIVLKIFYPHLALDIIDSNNKKIKFLNTLIKEIKLDNVKLIHDRVEAYALNNKDKYDLVTARAVANLNTLIELCLPLTKKDCYFIALKGNVDEEIQAITNELNILNGKLDKVIQFNLPIEKSLRNIVKIKKVDNTPAGYPRPYDKIKKKPL